MSAGRKWRRQARVDARSRHWDLAARLETDTRCVGCGQALDPELLLELGVVCECLCSITVHLCQDCYEDIDHVDAIADDIVRALLDAHDPYCRRHG